MKARKLPTMPLEDLSSDTETKRVVDPTTRLIGNSPCPATSAVGVSLTKQLVEQTKLIRPIPLSRLKIHPFNSRAVRTQGRIEDVRDMLEAEHKQREAITVVPGRGDDEGFYFILSGQTRYHAANLAGWSELDAQVNYEIDPANHLSFWAASIEHNTSIPETDWDLAVKIKALSEEGYTSEQMQKAARRNGHGIRRLIAMMGLPEPILAVVRDHPAVLTCYMCEILRSGLTELGVECIESMAKAVIKDGLSQRALDDQIKRATRRKKAESAGRGRRATREVMTPVLIGDAKHGEFKVMKSRDEGKKLITLTANLPDSLVESFRGDIQAALERLAASA